MYNPEATSAETYQRALREHLEELEEDSFAPFFVSSKSYRIIRKKGITTGLGKRIKLYDQLAFTFIWYKTKKIGFMGMIEHEYHMNSILYQEEEIPQIADLLFSMNSQGWNAHPVFERREVNDATIAIYEGGKHVIDCISDDYCEFFADANNPDALKYYKRITNGE